MRDPTEAQIVAGIAAAERESQAWSIEALPDGSCKVDDTNRLSTSPVPFLRIPIKREFERLEDGRMFVKYKVWGAGIKAALNA